MTAMRDLKLEDVLDEIRGRAARRLDGFVSEGRSQARRASGGHDDAGLFSAFTIGLLVGVVAGAAVALLMTPLSGVQARLKLSERLDRMRGDRATDPSLEQAVAGNGHSEAYHSSTPVS